MQLEQFLLFLKRHAEVFEEGEAFFFGFGGGNYGNGEAKNIFNILIRGFWENGVFFNANRQVTDIVHCLATNAAKVLGARQGNVN